MAAKDQQVTPITLAPTKFFVPKRTVRPMLHALTGTQPNPYQPQGAPGLQDRTDLSGKFSRRLGAIRRALTAADASVIEDRKELTLRHAEVFPALDKDGQPHPKAGKPTPVYATHPQTGAPIFKKDDAGNDTDERIVNADQYNLADPNAFEKEFKAMLEEFIVIECVGFTENDFNAFTAAPGQNSPIGKLIDPLMDLERDGPTDATPEQQAAALEAKAKTLVAEAAKIRAQATESPVEDEDNGPKPGDTVSRPDGDPAPTAP